MQNSLEAISQRAYNFDDALLIGLDEAAQNFITPLFKNINIIEDDDIHLSTSLCSANNNQLELSFLGGASGITPLAKIKALYEAIEKSISFTICQNNLIDDVYFFSTQNSPSTQFLVENFLMPKQLYQEDYQKNNYPWIELNHYRSAAQKNLLPSRLNLHRNPTIKKYEAKLPKRIK